MCNVPRFIKLLSDYDVWNESNQWAWQEEILPFQFGMRTMEGVYNPAAALWNNFFEGEVYLTIDGVCRIGKSVLVYQRQQNAEIMKRCAFDGELLLPVIAGKRWSGGRVAVIACNSPFCNSQLFDGFFDSAKHVLMVAFYIDAAGQFVVSLYATKDSPTDCSAIAAQVGGGGHARAAGFRSATLPLLLSNPQGAQS